MQHTLVERVRHTQVENKKDVDERVDDDDADGLVELEAHLHRHGDH
jgi:hypothetical protein